jgi:hypothetical protein
MPVRFAFAPRPGSLSAAATLRAFIKQYYRYAGVTARRPVALRHLVRYGTYWWPSPL